MIEKLRLEIRDSLQNKDLVEIGYVDSNLLYESATRLATATQIYNLGMAIAALSNSTYKDVYGSGYIELNSETATIDVDPSQYLLQGKCSFNVSDLNYGTPANEYWKSIGLNVDATPLFNSETQVAYLTQVDNFGQGFCNLSNGKLDGGLQFNEARISDEFDINAIIGEA